MMTGRTIQMRLTVLSEPLAELAIRGVQEPLGALHDDGAHALNLPEWAVEPLGLTAAGGPDLSGSELLEYPVGGVEASEELLGEGDPDLGEPREEE